MQNIPFEDEFEKFWINESGWYDGNFRGLSEEVLARQAWAKAFSIMVAKFTSDNSDYATALKVIEEYKQITPEKLRSCLGVECFAKQRLNASHFA